MQATVNMHCVAIILAYNHVCCSDFKSLSIVDESVIRVSHITPFIFYRRILFIIIMGS